jgi:hypothetical protein
MALDGITGKVKNALQVKNEMLLVEVYNEKKIEVLLRSYQ